MDIMKKKLIFNTIVIHLHKYARSHNKMLKGVTVFTVGENVFLLFIKIKLLQISLFLTILTVYFST